MGTKDGYKVIKMATPQKDSRTGIYQLRRGIPKHLRPFLGGRWEHKVSLETRDPEEAKRRFTGVNAAFEAMLEAAARLQRASQIQNAVEIADAYLASHTRDDLLRTAMKLSRLESGSHAYRLGLGSQWGVEHYDFGPTPTAEDLRDHRGRKVMLEAVHDLKALPWLETLRRIRALPTMQPLQWMIDSAAAKAGVAAPVGSELYTALGQALIARLCEACVPKIEPARTRIIPPEILITDASAFNAPISSDTIVGNVVALTPGSSTGTGPGLRAVFEDWCKHKPRDPKLIDEWSTAIRRFDALHNEPKVDLITAEMVRDFRKVYSRLPSRAPDVIAKLPLREQNIVAERDDLPTLAPATVNKALSAVRVMLDHAVEEMQILAGNIAKMVRGLATDGEVDSRLPFTAEDMQLIFTRETPQNKSGVSPVTMAWMLLLGPYTGCRLEELGKLRPFNIRTERSIPFIAIERDRKLVRDKEQKEGKQASKRSKTQAAYREIPVHPLLIEAGFLDLVRERRQEGAEWLFDDLTADKYGSRTKRLSRVINDWLDAIGLSDPELVYHSFRHTVRRVLRGRADRDLVDLIAGHADGSVGSKYGRGAALEPLRDAVNLISYPEVDWQPVVARARASLRA